MTIEQILQQGIAHHQHNRLADARACYEAVIQQRPGHATALHLLGVALGQGGDAAGAVVLIRRAIAVHPLEGMYHFNLGIFLLAAVGGGEAIGAFEEATRLKPAWTEAWLKLGELRRAAGNATGAAHAFHGAVRSNPNSAEAHNLLGAMLQGWGNHAGAEMCYQRAIALAPDMAEAHNNLGTLRRAAGRLDEAIAAYQEALRQRPAFAEALNNLGLALQSRGDVDAAIEEYEKALALKPAYAEAMGNLGGAYKDRAELDKALACFRRAAELRPDLAEAQSNALFTMQFDPAYDMAALFAEARRWAERFAQPLRGLIEPHANDRSIGRPLRIGYVSPDFRDHVQAFFMLPLLSHHDRAGFHVMLFSDAAVTDGVTARLCSQADEWRNIAGLSDVDVANLIRRERIDILVDLTMHMAGSRLGVFAQRPAPVQVTWLAYPGTTGLSTMDYRVTDRYLDPPGAEGERRGRRWYSEQSVPLETFWCYDPMTAEPAVGGLPAEQCGHVTFGSLNNFCKVNEKTLRLWARVMREVANSRLIMLAPVGKSREWVSAILREAGVEGSRVEFVARLPRAKYLAVYRRIDVGLDTWPSNGHTTSLDSFWMGVPVVTLAGPTITGRAGLSQLMNLGLAELIANSEAEFVRIAAGLAGDVERMRKLRLGLRDRMRHSPLMDGARFARNMEAAFRGMWERYCGR